MNREVQNLQDKVVIVTGVTSGLGVSIARVFAARGARVIGIGRRAERGEQVAAEVRAAGFEMTFMPADVGRVEDCRRIVEATVQRYGRVDALVNNAAVVGDRPAVPAHELEEAEWDKIVDINLKGVFFMCRHALVHMRRQKSGSIVNIASMNAVIGLANMIAYNSAKAGVVHLTRTLAVENVGEGINANAILLGGVASEGGEACTIAFGRMLRGSDWQPSRRIGDSPTSMDPAQVARALSLLCSDDGRLITGGAIPIDMAATSGALASHLVYLAAAELLPVG
jgi:NAD(P)-dependent dehydrogenase (short-subunit alcohol dehydrogenase family)